jgi:hypothetical protein
VEFNIGLLALAVGIAFDWQRLFPAIGDRIAALMALTVGSAWLSGGDIGGWFDEASGAGISFAGSAAHDVTTDVPASAGADIAGVVVGVVFLIWLLGFLPSRGFVSKHVSPNVSNKLTSGWIWVGVIFPPLIGLVPGRWGDFSSSVVALGANLGRTVALWILG